MWCCVQHHILRLVPGLSTRVISKMDHWDWHDEIMVRWRKNTRTSMQKENWACKWKLKSLSEQLLDSQPQEEIQTLLLCYESHNQSETHPDQQKFAKQKLLPNNTLWNGPNQMDPALLLTQAVYHAFNKPKYIPNIHKVTETTTLEWGSEVCWNRTASIWSLHQGQWWGDMTFMLCHYPVTSKKITLDKWKNAPLIYSHMCNCSCLQLLLGPTNLNK